MGTPAMTTRGFAEKDFEEVASFFHRSVTIAHEVNAKVGRKTFHSVVFFICFSGLMNMSLCVMRDC